MRERERALIEIDYDIKFGIPSVIFSDGITLVPLKLLLEINYPPFPPPPPFDRVRWSGTSCMVCLFTLVIPATLGTTTVTSGTPTTYGSV